MRERDVSSLVRQELTRDPEVLLFRSGVGSGYAGSVRPAIERAVAEDGMVGLARVWERHRISWGTVGHPDYSGLGYRRPFYVETKSSLGRLSPEQKLLIATLEARGAFVAVINDPGQAQAVLRALKAGEKGWRP